MLGKGFQNPMEVVMIASVIVVCLLYYYVLDHPRWNRWYCWLLIGVVLSLANLGVAGLMGASVSNSIEVGLLSFFFYFVFSFFVKWGSRNCKHSPFL